MEKKFVIKVENNLAGWTDVGQGVSLPDKVEIFGNLKEGDTLVLKSNEELKPGTKLAMKIAKQ